MITKDVTLRINIKKVTWSTSFGQIIVQFEKQKNSAARFLLLLFFRRWEDVYLLLFFKFALEPAAFEINNSIRTVSSFI